MKVSLSRRKDREIDEDVNYEGKEVNVILKWNEVTFLRYQSILEKME